MEWFVLAWDAFRAPQFPYDEALRLAREIVGRVAVKKTSDVILLDSSASWPSPNRCKGPASWSFGRTSP